ncbi:hypothetical protein E2562_016673 [Oryza meyeriana var. granulata]|uniref:Photosynthetic NDH subunit of subcomplex B 5, chloroplastic n=1 Tax=Oryza meyeriana var. granulata TaxID=110450 RepID=A0A6G1ELI5_9ORYZ|nr:hypothetical protein E2562_016673 [Oryza meyeriana var. granulata]
MMSSSLVSAISASPSAAAATAKARPRHDDAATAAAAARQQLRIKPTHAGCGCCRSRGRAVVARAGPGPLTEIEPDLREDPIDKWRTNGVSPEDFEYGVYDGHHTYHETQDKKGFWEDVSEWYQEAEPPQGFQALISWLFPPAIILGMAFNVPGEYLYIGAAVFVVVFCIIEMDKPDKPHNFEPEIYMMERSARDKLIADYNTMDIWDFNEKYGELWDFTVDRRDEIVKS